MQAKGGKPAVAKTASFGPQPICPNQKMKEAKRNREQQRQRQRRRPWDDTNLQTVHSLRTCRNRGLLCCWHQRAAAILTSIRLTTRRTCAFHAGPPLSLAMRPTILVFCQTPKYSDLTWKLPCSRARRQHFRFCGRTLLSSYSVAALLRLKLSKASNQSFGVL